MEVRRVVPVAVQEGVDVVPPREPDGLVDDVRMPEGKVDRVVGAERRAERRHLRQRTGLVADPRNDLAIDVAVVLIVPRQPLRRMTGARVETLLVDAIHAGDLDRAPLDQIANGPDQPEVLVLEEVPERGRVPDHRPARIAVPQEIDAAAERRRIPGDVLAIHFVRTFRGRAGTARLRGIIPPLRGVAQR